MNKQKYEHILDVSRQTRSFSLLCWYLNYVHVAQGGISFYLLYPSFVIILIPRPHKSIKGNVMTYHIQRHTILVKLFNAYCTSYIIHSIFPENHTLVPYSFCVDFQLTTGTSNYFCYIYFSWWITFRDCFERKSLRLCLNYLWLLWLIFQLYGSREYFHLY